MNGRKAHLIRDSKSRWHHWILVVVCDDNVKYLPVRIDWGQPEKAKREARKILTPKDGNPLWYQGKVRWSPTKVGGFVSNLR